ncbi:hypothetical protein QJQ45_009306 [Haematococcus lacustris]|nr:hypothetical protein QJQ45_009306 [Haematococcus lacustris]
MHRRPGDRDMSTEQDIRRCAVRPSFLEPREPVDVRWSRREKLPRTRAAEAEAKAQALAAEAEAQAQADAGAYEAQLHQLQADLQQREQEVADTQRLQHLQQQMQDIQREEIQHKEQQVVEQQIQLQQQQADLHLREQQVTEQQIQLQQQQADMHLREQQVVEQQHQLQQQQADLHLREQQVAEQLHQLQQQQQADMHLREQQVVEQQHQLQQQQADMHLREQQVAEQQHQLQQQQQADMHRREQQVAEQLQLQQLQQQLNRLQQQLEAQSRAELQRQVQQQLAAQQHLLQHQQADLLLKQQHVEKQLQEAADRQVVSTNHPLPDHPTCSPLVPGSFRSPLFKRPRQDTTLTPRPSLPARHHIVAPALRIPGLPYSAVVFNNTPAATCWMAFVGGLCEHYTPAKERAWQPAAQTSAAAKRVHSAAPTVLLSTSNRFATLPVADEQEQQLPSQPAKLDEPQGAAASIAAAAVAAVLRAAAESEAAKAAGGGGKGRGNKGGGNMCRVGSSKKSEVRMSRRYVDRSLKKLYLEYEQECPVNLKVGSTTFEMLRPPWVKRITAAHKQVCVCIPCETCELLLDQLGKHMDSLVVPEDPQPPDDSDSDSESDSDANNDGGDAEVHVVLAEHIANADAQDLAGVLDAGVLDEGGLEKLVSDAQNARAAAGAAGGGAAAARGTAGGAAVRVDLDYATVQSWFVCPCKVGAKPSLACLQRQCAACKDRKVGVKAEREGVQLQYRQFKKIDNGQGVELATVQTTLGELVVGLNDLMQKQLWHQYLAKHQRATFRAHCAAVRNTPGLVVVSCDWSEKLTIHQDIACQGAYWKQRTMSVFVACAHFQDMAGNYREESVFVSADKCDQSAEASTTALVQVIECLLQGGRPPDGVGDGRDDGEGWVGKMDMRQLCLWSDGCASQFKGAKAIKLHWHLANRFGVPVQWSYGATSHFKSTHDSEGGVAKREWREQMLVHPELVGKVCGAAVLTDWANKHFAVPCHAQDTSASHRQRGHIMRRCYLVLDNARQATVCSMPEADVERMHGDVVGCRAMHRMVFTPDGEQPQWAMAGCACNTCMSVPCLPCMKPDTTTPLVPMPMFQDTVKEVREDEECYALLMLYHSDLLHDEVCFGKLTNKHCERYRMHMGWKRQETRRELRRLVRRELLSDQLEAEYEADN